MSKNKAEPLRVHDLSEGWTRCRYFLLVSIGILFGGQMFSLLRSGGYASIAQKYEVFCGHENGRHNSDRSLGWFYLSVSLCPFKKVDCDLDNSSMAFNQSDLGGEVDQMLLDLAHDRNCSTASPKGLAHKAWFRWSLFAFQVFYSSALLVMLWGAIRINSGLIFDGLLMIVLKMVSDGVVMAFHKPQGKAVGVHLLSVDIDYADGGVGSVVTVSYNDHLVEVAVLASGFLFAVYLEVAKRRKRAKKPQPKLNYSAGYY